MDVLAIDKRGEFEAYASIFNVRDLQDDIVTPGAFVNLKSWLETGAVLWDHDTARPVAVPLEARDDGIGLWVRGRFHSTADAQAARTVVVERQAAGKPYGLSIGYLPLFSRPGGDGTRLLVRVYLLEVSLVSIPANPHARVQVAKAWAPADAARLLTPAQLQSAALVELMRASGVPIR